MVILRCQLRRITILFALNERHTMAQAKYEFAGLSTREGFNRSLRHFKIVGEILGSFEARRNLADLLSELQDEKRMDSNQIAPVVNALFVGHPKYRYVSRSHNLVRNVEDFSPILSAAGKWTAVDMVIAYYHPDLGLTLINPKNSQHWETAGSLKRNELLTIYCGAFAQKAQERLLHQAIETLIDLLEGRKPKIPPALTKGKFKQKPARPAAPPAPVRQARVQRARRQRAVPERQERFASRAALATPAATAAPAAAAQAVTAVAAPPSGKQRMTPMYSIPVTNELFHNGNVEAWKKIIQSYNQKYPGLEVFVFYEGERIHDINTLFKWGKVKHGSTVVIAVAGDNIQDVAKLQRYLRQGASPAFESFLRFPVNTVLNLF